MNKSIVNKSNLTYTSCYCEENIWLLINDLKDVAKEKIEEFFVVFISNKNRQVPVWCQKKCVNPTSPVIWDYHVITIHKCSASLKSLVYDIDTNLEFPETFKTYCEKALPELPNIKEEFKRLYKVIPAKYYLEHFASDRSHMIDVKTGNYLAQPPIYSCIQTKESSNNIDEFIQMELCNNETQKQSKHGIIMNENCFRNFFILN